MSSALSMFRKTAGHGDVKKSAQKVADTKKDSLTRLKHLRAVLENYDIQDAKRFFQDNYSHIYYIFYDNFAIVEADLKQRASKAHREELEGILHIFEKILFLLPELIHKRWMFHSIGRILKKLLHPANSLQLRRQGVRLFLVWYQILQENASDECHHIFLQLVPGLGEGDLSEFFVKAAGTPDSISGIIAAGEITPILPSSTEKMPENITKYFLDHLLNYMVSEVIKIEWVNKEMRESSFTFLWDKFKTKYLRWLLPDFLPRDIYEPVLELPRERSEEEMKTKDEPSNVAECRDSFVIWLANFTMTNRRPDPDLVKGLSCSALTESPAGAISDDGRDLGDARVEKDEKEGTKGGGEAGTPDVDSIHSSQGGEEHSVTEYEIVRAVLYSTRENVNIVHECFRQALLFSFKHTPAIRKVIAVYKEWFQDSPSASALSLAQSNLLAEERQRYKRNRSYLGAVEDLADAGAERQQDVRAGTQRVLQVFLTNAANIFLITTEDNGSLQEQVDLCKRVLNIYRHVVMNSPLNQKTWEQMLRVLLCITSGVLKATPPRERHRSLGGRLAQPIFQTLIVTWIKANLNVLISMELWDEFLAVLSSLTSWIELIKEWAKTMETLTRVLARQVYGLDLLDLPLERLSEQKEKRRRGKESTKVKSSADRSFVRSWSRGECQMNTLRSSTNSAPNPETGPPFERGKFRSDGAGGSRSRPEGLQKQRSLSNEHSPSHSRCASSSTEGLVRSSSEGHIADPRELIEKLRGSNFVSDSIDNGSADADVDSSALTACSDIDSQPSASSQNQPSESLSGQGMEDPEVAAITAVCTAELATWPGSESMPPHPDHPGFYINSRESITPSPSGSLRSGRSKSGSRSPSPTEMMSDSLPKDSPTPDRDSLHIEMVASNQETSLSRDSLLESKSVMAGGTMPGWTPDVAVVLWQRMLGCLGDVNKIEDPDIHASVFSYLCDLLDTLFRISDNLGVTPDNMSSPPPSELIPPTHIFASWLFECLQLNSKYKKGQLLAYRLICQIMLRTHQVMASTSLLARFYNVLHSGLVCSDQDVPNVLVSNCGPRFFSLPLPGSILLTLDFINAAGNIIAAVDYKEPPRAEAVSILGALLSIPNYYREVPVLQSPLHTTALIEADELKDRIVELLLKAGKREPAGLARCVAVSSIGLYLYGELTHNSQHPKMKEAFSVLLGALMCANKKVAKVASDMLMMLCDHTDRLLDHHPHMPKKIAEAIATTISSLIQSHDSSKSDEEKRLIVLMMFSMVEWCLRMPLHLLMETSDLEKSCLHKVFRVLHSAVTGHSSSSLSRVSKSLADFMQDTDFTNIWDSNSTDRRAPNGIAVDQSGEELKTPLTSVPKTETDIVKLAARSLMTHLVNHLGHFPMGLGAARLHTIVQEHHDLPDLDDLKPDIFDAPNVQLFVLNHRCLISFIELPAVDAPGGGVTAGLTTARTVCRIIVRDLSGKYCWENSVLYSPPWCTKESSRQNAEALLGLATGQELQPLIIQEEMDVSQPAPSPRRKPTELPTFETTTEVDDNLNDVLRYVGGTSPECLLQLGCPLNIESPLPEVLSAPAESELTTMVRQQMETELRYYNKHKAHQSMLAKPQMPKEIEDPISPFQMCRMLLDQMGLLSWEKRCHFDLLRKSDKLLRELKNLDAQRCRETHKIAVIYVAEGQEDKNSILSNRGASRAFEDFVAGLGWEVDLETHQGFLGGLQQNKTTGETAPYFANSTCEVIFHVSTRIPCVGNDWHIKMRHLGNDEVHIVWSEHTRDYRRGIIPTEFGDIIIAIYPLDSGLFRIQINCKPEIPFFGPLFDGAIVDHLVLPGLVRATAVNASRVKRSLMPFFHAFYEERAKCLESVIQQHTENTTFEEFAANVFAPVLPNNATITDVFLPSETSNSSLSEVLLTHVESTATAQLSPVTARQRGLSDVSVRGDSIDSGQNMLARTARRLSMKSRKSSSSSRIASPGSSFESPNSPTAAKGKSPSPHSPKNNGKSKK